MKVEEFAEQVKKARLSTKITGQIGVKVSTTPTKLVWWIYKEDACRYCHRKSERRIMVEFNSPQEHLTIFEAEMLYSVFGEGRKPRDYAGYHKCEAGRKFVENIKEIERSGVQEVRV